MIDRVELTATLMSFAPGRAVDWHKRLADRILTLDRSSVDALARIAELCEEAEAAAGDEPPWVDARDIRVILSNADNLEAARERIRWVVGGYPSADWDEETREGFVEELFYAHSKASE